MARDRNADPNDDRNDDRRADLGPDPEKLRSVARDEEEEEYGDAEEYDETNPDEEDEGAF